MYGIIFALRLLLILLLISHFPPLHHAFRRPFQMPSMRWVWLRQELHSIASEHQVANTSNHLSYSLKEATPSTRYNRIKPQQYEINQHIGTCFAAAKGKKVALQELKLYLNENIELICQTNAIKLLQRCCKNRIAVTNLLPARRLLELLDAEGEGVADVFGIANWAFSMKYRTGRERLDQELMLKLSEHLLWNEEAFYPRAVSMCLFGLRDIEWRHLFKLHQHYQQQQQQQQQEKEAVDSSSLRLLSAMQYTLLRNAVQNQSSGMTDHARHHFQTQLQKMASAIREKNYTTAFSIPLQLMNSTSHSKPALHLGMPMTMKEISVAYVGLQRIPSSVLLPVVNECCGNCAIIYPILFFIEYLTQCLPLSTGALDSRAVANILLGFKSCVLDHDDILSSCADSSLLYRSLDRALNVLCDHIEQQDMFLLNHLSANDLADALWGMQGINSNLPAARRMLSLLNKALHRITNSPDHEKTNQLYFRTGESLSFALGSLRNRRMNEPQVDVLIKHLISIIQHTIEVYAKDLTDQSTFSSPAKKQWHSKRQQFSLSDRQLGGAIFGLRRMKAEGDVLQLHECLAILTDNYLTVDFMSNDALALAFNGFQSMTSDANSVRRLMRSLTHRMDSNVHSTSGRHIGMICNGLQKAVADNDAVEHLLWSISQRIEKSSMPFSFAEISSATYGLQKMSSNSPHVRDVLKQLGLKLIINTSILKEQLLRRTSLSRHSSTRGISSPYVIDSRDVAMCMVGLQGMSSHWKEVQLFIDALADRLELARTYQQGLSNNLVMTSKEVAMMFRGLRSMGGGSPMPLPTETIGLTSKDFIGKNLMRWVEGRDVVSRRKYRPPTSLKALLFQLYTILQHNQHVMTAPDLCQVLYSLQGVGCETYEVRQIVRTVMKVLSSSETQAHSTNHLLTGRRLSNAVFGMQNMTSRGRVVRQMMSTLATTIQASNATFNAQDIGNALYALQGMSSSVRETRLLVAALAEKIENMPTVIYRNDTMSILRYNNGTEGVLGIEEVSKYMLNGQHIGNALWGLRNMSTFASDSGMTTQRYRMQRSDNCKKTLPTTTQRPRPLSGGVRIIDLNEEPYEEVVRLLTALAIRIKDSSAKLNGQNIGNALYALHAMDPSRVPAVREILASLAHKIMTSDESDIAGLDLGMALYGLRNMDTSLEEVVAVLATLILRMKHSDVKLEIHELSLANIGTLNAPVWIRDDILAYMAKQANMKYMG